MRLRQAPRFGFVATAVACGVLSAGRVRGADVAVHTSIDDLSRVDVATASGSLLVVWQDDSGSDLNIRAARVDANGAVLGAGVFDVCTAAGVQSWPAVTSDGTDFFVVWQDERSGSAEVWGARVDSDGTVADANGFQISSGTGAEKYPDVGWTGSAYLAVWQDSRDVDDTDWDIFAARIGADGTLLNSGAAAIKVTGMGKQDAAAVAGSGGSALVVFRDDNDIMGAMVDSAGTPGVPFPVGAALDTQKSPAVAFGRGIYLVAWEDYRDRLSYPDVTNADIYAARVSAAGALLDASHIPVAKASDRRCAVPAVAHDGANFVVTWEDGPDGASDIFMARVLADAAGITVRESGGLAVSQGGADQDESSLAMAGTGVLVVWADSRGGNLRDVYAMALGTDDPPVAEAGSAILVWLDEIVALDGGASSDPEGMPLTYSWVQIPAPTVALSAADTATPGFTAPAASETLTFELTVSDGAQIATDQVVVTVAPVPLAGTSSLCGASGADGSPLLVALAALVIVILLRRAGARSSGGRVVG